MTALARLFPNGEWRLILAVLAEIALFAVVAPNFLTVGNFFEVTRLSVELGLLAVALTPVIVGGGIDLSVGAMLGLSAVVFGAAHKDFGLSIPLAAVSAVIVGAAGGALNALLIARLEIPPLIVTLGSLSLFRGIAEGITHAATNYTDFPRSFLALGQGYLGGVIPAQLPLFVLVVAGYVILLHRSIIGRALYAIGFSPAGARYAGIPVRRRVGLVYLLSGVVSSLAAIVYVAHLGQARSDAGNGYELDAITAVVLGGTSVFGGRGTLWGTLLGLFAISILRNGLQLAALPSELAGVLTGTLLLATIAIDRLRLGEQSSTGYSSEEEVKNSQVAVLCATIVAGSLIVASTNVWLVRSLQPMASPSIAAGTGAASGPGGRRPVIAMMPKAKGDPYFISCRAGAEEAAKELGVELIWDGPTGLDAARQNELVENWITRGVDAIAVAVENRAGISTVLRKARGRGIKVLTWDADAEPDARDFFVNQATPEGIANALTDEAARLLSGTGEFAIITGALSAANQNEWIAFIKKRQAEKYPGLKLATIRPSDDDRDKAFAETQTIMRVYPNVKLVMAISAPAVPGIGGSRAPGGAKGRQRHRAVTSEHQQAVRPRRRRAGRHPVEHARPRLPHRPRELDVRREEVPARRGVDSGRQARDINLRGSEIVLGAPLLMNKANIDKYDF